MKTDVWEKCFRASADRQRARHFYGLLAQTPARQTLQQATLEQAQVLCAVFSGSVALSTLLLGRPDWLTEMIPERLEFPRRKSGMVKK